LRTRPTITASDSRAKPRSPAAREAKAAPAGRREQNKQEKLARIAAAAKALFAAKGFAQTTTQEIAERAEIGAGTLFLYAKSKEDLLVMVFKDEMIETSRAGFERVDASDPLLDQLMYVFGVMIAYHERDLGLARVLIREVTIPTGSERRHHIAVLMRAIYSGIGDLIRAAQRDGALRPEVDAESAAQNLFAVYYFGLIAWLSGNVTKPQFKRRLRARLALVIDGIAAQSRGRPA
jgi:AcrR family transcriptional regulator